MNISVLCALVVLHDMRAFTSSYYAYPQWRMRS